MWFGWLSFFLFDSGGFGFLLGFSFVWLGGGDLSWWSIVWLFLFTGGCGAIWAFVFVVWVGLCI